MGEHKRSRNFREYKVWQDAVACATLVYETTAQLPWFEKKGLCDQLQRAVVSISSNIAEGAGRPSDADFAAQPTNPVECAQSLTQNCC